VSPSKRAWKRLSICGDRKVLEATSQSDPCFDDGRCLDSWNIVLVETIDTAQAGHQEVPNATSESLVSLNVGTRDTTTVQGSQLVGESGKAVSFEPSPTDFRHRNAETTVQPLREQASGCHATD
jgi:hypothetical protein